MFAKWHGWSGRFLLSIMVILIAVLVQPAQSTQANASLAVDPFDVLQTVAQKGVGTASSFVTGSSILGGERDVVSTVTAGTARLRVLVNFGGSRRLSHNQQTGVAAKTEVQWDGVDGSATVNPVGLGSLNLAAANAFVVESAKLDFGAISLKMTVYSGASSCSSLTKNLVAGLARDMSFPFAAFQPACSSPANFASVGAITLLIDGTLQQDSDASIGPVKLVGGSIGNYVWLDENNDGYQDAGEPGIPNVVVELLDDQGNVVATTVTDAHGGYLFTGLVPGTYTVRVDQTTLPKDQDGNVAMTQTTHPVNGGADFGNQDDANGYTVTIGAGEENLTADFGFNWNTDDEVNNNNGNAALGDRVWVDVNGNGAQEPEEIGVEGVLVNLITAGPDGLFGTGDDVVFDTDITDANGNYIFDNLPPGAYVVEIDVSNFASGGALEGYTQTGDPDHFGTTGTNNDDQTTTPVVLAPGDVFLNADFGYQPPDAQNNSIGDKVWFDADADGVGPNGNGAAPGDDNSETGIPGVTVALIRDANGNGVWDAGESIIATTTTDANGDYLFSGLPDGSYLVWVNDTDNVLGDKVPTYDSDDGTAPTGSGAPTGVTANSVLGLSSVLNLGVSTAAPDSNLVQDFGYTAFGQTDTTGLIGDRVWLDIDGDGVQDANEPGLEGIRVELRDGSNNLIGVTFTDENGNYYFGGLPAGTYTVVVATPPAGMTQTFDADGIGTAHQSTVTIGAGEINLLQDFGYRGPGSIGDFVWEDLNANGVVDAGENGIAGVTLDLYHDLNGNGQVDAGEPLVGSTITDANGQYSFTGLFVDDGGGDAAYVVDVTDRPACWLAGGTRWGRPVRTTTARPTPMLLH